MQTNAQKELQPCEHRTIGIATQSVVLNSQNTKSEEEEEEEEQEEEEEEEEEEEGREEEWNNPSSRIGKNSRIF